MVVQVKSKEVNFQKREIKINKPSAFQVIDKNNTVHKKRRATQTTCGTLLFVINLKMQALKKGRK